MNAMNNTVRLKADAKCATVVIVACVALTGALSGLRTFAVSASSGAAAEPSDLDPRIVKLVQAVSEDRLVAILKKLESSLM